MKFFKMMGIGMYLEELKKEPDIDDSNGQQSRIWQGFLSCPLLNLEEAGENISTKACFRHHKLLWRIWRYRGYHSLARGFLPLVPLKQ